MKKKIRINPTIARLALFGVGAYCMYLLYKEEVENDRKKARDEEIANLTETDMK